MDWVRPGRLLPVRQADTQVSASEPARAPAWPHPRRQGTGDRGAPTFFSRCSSSANRHGLREAARTRASCRGIAAGARCLLGTSPASGPPSADFSTSCNQAPPVRLRRPGKTGACVQGEPTPALPSVRTRLPAPTGSGPALRVGVDHRRFALEEARLVHRAVSVATRVSRVSISAGKLLQFAPSL